MSSRFSLIPGLHPSGYAREILFKVKADTLPIQPIEIAESLGLITDEKEFPDDRYDGLFMRIGEQGLIAVNKRISYESRKRFTYAHELGHATIKGHSDLEHRCTPRDIFRFNCVNKKEREANEFASELLMPTKFFLEDIKKREFNFATLEELAECKYETSLTATAIRFVKETLERCAVILVVNGIVEWGVKSSSFRFEIKTRKPVSENTFAWDYFNGGHQLDGKPERVLSNAWLNTSNPNSLVYESSKSFGNLGMVLTLLWL